jgi:hypothetical protein
VGSGDATRARGFHTVAVKVPEDDLGAFSPLATASFSRAPRSRRWSKIILPAPK